MYDRPVELENTAGRWIGRTGIQDGSRDWDDGQARAELTKQTSTDSWNRQAGKVSGIVRARNKIGSTTYVIQIVRNRYISLLLHLQTPKL